MTYKEVQEEEIKKFDEKFPFAIIDWKLGKENDSDGTSIDKMKEIKSHLLSAMQRSALAVLGMMRERMPPITCILNRYQDDGVHVTYRCTECFQIWGEEEPIPLCKEPLISRATLTKSLDEIEKELTAKE